MAELARVRATVRGRVQMVGFRVFVAEHAQRLHGTVANRADGSLECLVEGPADDVERLVALLHRGPAHARVESVELEHEAYRGDLPPFMVTA